MNKQKEENFIKKYVQKNRQERLRFELTNEKKRKAALDRFSHSTLEIIDKSKIIAEMQKTNDEIIIKHLSSNDNYVLSGKYIDGLDMSSKAALQEINEEFGPVIVISSKCAIIKTEGYGNKTYILN